MEYKIVTFNMPVTLHNHLKLFVGNKKMSKFVAEAVQDKIRKMETNLKDAYLSANNDNIRNQEIKSWENTEFEDWK
jgi:hypothetical protein